MNLISADSISKTKRDKLLFENISFGIESHEKIAIIGVNGSGKSTLFSLLAGLEPPDTGSIAFNNNLKAGYLPQKPVFNDEHTIMEHIFSDTTEEMQILREYELALEAGDEAGIAKSMEEIEKRDLWAIEEEVKSILTELGITDFEQKMKELSGGMVKKADLARALIVDANLLLLDEPTNHLDLDTIQWLQNYLQNTSKAILLVTHDRYFLDAICTAILEIHNQGLLRYEGNYSYYLEKKDEIANSENSRQNRIQSILRMEMEWLKRGPRARTSKDKKRKANIVDLTNSLSGPQAELSGFSVDHKRLGKKVLELENIEIAFDGRKIIAPFTYSFSRGLKIGIVGPNGSGKSTFLKLISGRLTPDAGNIDIGVNTTFAYYDQLSSEMNQKMKVLEYLEDYADTIKLKKGEDLSPSVMLERFLFPKSMFYTEIGDLSGGERRRLYLIRTLLGSPNFLIFDEPTNDLDIQTLGLLEDFLIDFKGCSVIVSHDRYFLDRVTDLMFIFDGEGGIKGFAGNYSDYLAYREEEKRELKKQAAAEKPKGEKVRIQKEKTKLTFKEQKEYEGLMEEIEALEDEKAELEAFFSSADADPGQMAEKQKRYQEVSDLIPAKIERWEYLAQFE